MLRLTRASLVVFPATQPTLVLVVSRVMPDGTQAAGAIPGVKASVRAASLAALSTSTFLAKKMPNCAIEKIKAIKKGATRTNSMATTPLSSLFVWR